MLWGEEVFFSPIKIMQSGLYLFIHVYTFWSNDFGAKRKTRPALPRGGTDGGSNYLEQVSD